MKRNSMMMVGAAAAALAAGSANGQLLDGDFEMDVLAGSSLQTYYAGSKVGAWTVGKGSIDLKNSKSWQAASGSQSVDLAGLSDGSIFQDVELKGGTYALSFSMAGHPVPKPPVKHMKVYWDTTLVADLFFNTAGNSLENLGYQKHVFELDAEEGIHRLTFENLESCNCGYGVALDAVSLTAVPEPATGALAGLGGALALAGMISRNRRTNP